VLRPAGGKKLCFSIGFSENEQAYGARNKMTFLPRTSVSDIIWPRIPSPAGAMLTTIQFQLQQSEWWPHEKLQAMQFRQLQLLLQHAYESSPYYRRQFDAAGFDVSAPLTAQSWRNVPVLPRDDLQDRAGEILSTRPPEHHGEPFEKKTSGSTGRQLKIVDTEANHLFWMAITLRDHLWHQRRFSGHMVCIRSGRSGKDPMTIYESDNWGPSTANIFETGPSTIYYHTMPIEKQAELLLDRQPEYLLIYPSNAVRLTEYFRAHNLKLNSLRGVITYGELLMPETRTACQELWNAPLTDMYSCEEVGYIALQCPQSEHYHCQPEAVFVEVLNPQGEPCLPGESGRVVLTSLHNFAMPIIRYENLDHAVAGGPCECGRSSPVIERLLGRKRNMAVGVDGAAFWPRITRDMWAVVPGIEELQLVQTTQDKIEVRLIRPQPMNAEQQATLTASIQRALGQPYAFEFTYVDEIIRHANGKYERYICKLAAE